MASGLSPELPNLELLPPWPSSHFVVILFSFLLISAKSLNQYSAQGKRKSHSINLYAQLSQVGIFPFLQPTNQPVAQGK